MSSGPGFAGLGWLAIIAGGAAGAQQPAVASDDYRIASLTFRLPAGQSVGPKRAGALCIPAGGIAWREARPDGDDARGAVVRALTGVGLGVRPADLAAADDDTPARFRIAGEVVALRLSACVPPGGLGRLLNHSHTVKGDGSIAVRWTVTDRATRQVTARVSCVAFPYRSDTGLLSDMTLAGLAAAAHDLGAGLGGGGSTGASAGEEFCRAAARSEESGGE